MRRLNGDSPARRERRRALRDAILAAYDEAGLDPEFVAEVEQINAEFAHTLLDGLEDEKW